MVLLTSETALKLIAGGGKSTIAFLDTPTDGSCCIDIEV